MTPLTNRLPLKCSVPSAGFARATESSGEVRKGGDAPHRDSQAWGTQGQYLAMAPPSTRRSAPVIISASSEARNTQARA